MRSTVLCGLVMCSVLAVVGCGSKKKASPAATDTASLCKRLCTTGATLNCPNEGLVVDCSDPCEDAVAQLPPTCAVNANAYLRCAAPLPASSMECDSDGKSGPKASSCATERAALQACALPTSDAGMPGPDSCQYANDGTCDEPTNCESGTDTTDCAGGSDSCQYANDGVCDEPTNCEVGTDTTDCANATPGDDSCQYANDGVCDEPTNCEPGTDTTDCAGT